MRNDTGFPRVNYLKYACAQNVTKETSKTMQWKITTDQTANVTLVSRTSEITL